MNAIETNEAVVRRFIEDAFNGRDLDVLDEIVAEGVTNHDPPFPGLPAGRKGLTQVCAGFWSAFPDIHATAVHLIADEDKVGSVVSLRGTHQGELMGLSPTSREVNVRVVEIFRVTGGQIAERWGVVDRTALMAQLGAVARENAAAARG
jgi:predicted ester cyclase